MEEKVGNYIDRSSISHGCRTVDIILGGFSYVLWKT